MQSLIALADPNRRRMVEMLAGRELSSGEIGSEFEISAPAVSQHLKVLKEASIVRVRVDGQRRKAEEATKPSSQSRKQKGKKP